MPVNETLATYSDWAYASALAVYVLAFLLHAAGYAFTRKVTGKQAAAQLVGAGASAPPGVVSVNADQRPLPERLTRMGVSLTVLAALIHFGSLALRGLAVHRVPWGNMYEFGSAICMAAVIAWLVVLRRHPLRRLGAFVLLPVVVLLFLSGTLLYVQAAPLMPALRSYWIVIHVSAAVIASGILLVPGVLSVLYVLRAAHEFNPARLATFASRLPTSDTLDRIAYRTTVFAFPIWTFAIIAGAIWAEAAWGRYWGWDPKEVCSFVAWVVYAAYLHARATAGWRGGRAAVINIFGFAVMLFNLFFINLVTSGLHSYSGV